MIKKNKLEVCEIVRITYARRFNKLPFNCSCFRLHTKQPLFDMEICIIGEIKLPKKDIEKKIKAMGGKIASQIHDGLAAVISTAKDVNRAYDDDLREAFMRGIQVVPEEFLEDVIMCDDPIQLIVRMDMSNRGKDVSFFFSAKHFDCCFEATFFNNKEFHFTIIFFCSRMNACQIERSRMNQPSSSQIKMPKVSFSAQHLNSEDEWNQIKLS